MHPAHMPTRRPIPINVVPLQRAHAHQYAVVQILLHYDAEHPGLWYKLRCLDDCPAQQLISRQGYRMLREAMPGAEFDPFGLLKPRHLARPIPDELLV